jgi:RNA polymerase sigma-70 factor (ECF subfamily)
MKLETPSAEVVERARRGEGPAREALASRYYPAVFSFARKLTGRADIALDVTQETFLRAFSRLEQHDPSYSFASWLFKIAANHVRDLHRRPDRPEPVVADTSEPSAESILERSEDLDRVRRALDRLPSDLRLALTLHLQEELPVREIAFVLDLTDNSVRMKIYRGLQKVRALVREES